MDKYDEAVAYLTEYPARINSAWSHPTQTGPGCLFRFLDPKPDLYGVYGCITQIKAMPNYFKSPDDDLTEKIRADPRVPSGDIQVADLPVFAEYQREFDRRYPNR